MKYIGIYFDSWLTSDQHIANIAENFTKLIHMLGKSANLQWGLGHKSLRTVYEGALIPLCYMESLFGKRLLQNQETSTSCREYRG